MDKNSFLKEVATIINAKELHEDDMLTSFPQWDSLSAMNVLTLLEDEFQVDADFEEINDMKTVAELLKKAGLA